MRDAPSSDRESGHAALNNEGDVQMERRCQTTHAVTATFQRKRNLAGPSLRIVLYSAPRAATAASAREMSPRGDRGRGRRSIRSAEE